MDTDVRVARITATIRLLTIAVSELGRAVVMLENRTNPDSNIKPSPSQVLEQLHHVTDILKDATNEMRDV